MNHRDAEDAEEVLRKKVSALGTQRAIRIDRQSNSGLVENDRCSLRALRLCGSNYLTNCFISIYHSVALRCLDGPCPAMSVPPTCGDEPIFPIVNSTPTKGSPASFSGNTNITPNSS